MNEPESTARWLWFLAAWIAAIVFSAVVLDVHGDLSVLAQGVAR